MLVRPRGSRRRTARSRRLPGAPRAPPPPAMPTACAAHPRPRRRAGRLRAQSRAWVETQTQCQISIARASAEHADVDEVLADAAGPGSDVGRRSAISKAPATPTPTPPASQRLRRPAAGRGSDDADEQRGLERLAKDDQRSGEHGPCAYSARSRPWPWPRETRRRRRSARASGADQDRRLGLARNDLLAVQRDGFRIPRRLASWLSTTSLMRLFAGTFSSAGSKRWFLMTSCTSVSAACAAPKQDDAGGKDGNPGHESLDAHGQFLQRLEAVEVESRCRYANAKRSHLHYQFRARLARRED